MSRVIKFRAWTGKRMLTIDPLERKGTLSDLVEDESWKVMQFTGLTDRNGVEIYESDVVRWLVNTDHSVDAPVGFESGAFYMLDAINQGYGKVYNDWLRGEYTVLGNIYEHPELLEAKP